MLFETDKVKEAVQKALSRENNPERKFKQSVEIVVTFKDVDMKRGDVKLREIVYLPKKTSKERKVVVVPVIEMMEKAKALSPSLILTKDDLQKLQGNKRLVKKIADRNDWFLIAQESLGLAGRILGPALGPRGKFPTPIPNNANLDEVIPRYKNATLVKTKDQPQTQAFVGTEDMKPEDLTANIVTVLNSIEAKVKPENVRALYVKTDMGRPIEVRK